MFLIFMILPLTISYEAERIALRATQKSRALTAVESTKSIPLFPYLPTWSGSGPVTRLPAVGLQCRGLLQEFSCEPRGEGIERYGDDERGAFFDHEYLRAIARACSSLNPLLVQAGLVVSTTESGSPDRLRRPRESLS